MLQGSLTTAPSRRTLERSGAELTILLQGLLATSPQRSLPQMLRRSGPLDSTRHNSTAGQIVARNRPETAARHTATAGQIVARNPGRKRPLATLQPLGRSSPATPAGSSRPRQPFCPGQAYAKQDR